jgi:hypothetical protein
MSPFTLKRSLGFIALIGNSPNYQWQHHIIMRGRRSLLVMLGILSKNINSYTNESMKACRQYWIGECYEKMNDLKQARANYQEVVDKFYNTVFGGHAHKKVRELDKIIQPNNSKSNQTPKQK